MKLSRDKALDILYGNEGGEVILDEIVDTSRWSVHHDLVVKIDGKFYSAEYSVGATEYQNESPWQNENEVEFVEVEPKEVTTIKYIVVKKPRKEI